MRLPVSPTRLSIFDCSILPEILLLALPVDRMRWTKPEAQKRNNQAEVSSILRYQSIPRRALPTKGGRGKSELEKPGATISVRRHRCMAQFCGHSYELGERIGFHLLHNPAAVCLHGDLADSKFATDLLVQ